MKKLGYAVLGLGIGMAHAEAAEASEYADLVAACDIDEKRLEKFASIYPNATLYRDFEELLKDERVDIISICLPSSMHADFAVRAMEAGKNVLVERFMCCDYIAAYYTVRDGKCQLSMLMDKDMNRIGRGNVPFPTAFVSPSIYYDRYVEEIDPIVCRMMNDMGYKDGTFLISFFVNGHHFYAVELTCRLAATREYEFIYKETGIDILAEQIANAVGDGDSCQELTDLGRSMNKNVNCMLFIFVKEGIIGNIKGISDIRNMRGVLNVLQLREEGSTIRADGSYGQLFARIYLSTEDKRSMIELVNTIKKTLSVTSADGDSQLIDGFMAEDFFVMHK